MSSKDNSLDLIEKLDLLKKEGSDYLLIVIEPGKHADRADVWYELKDKNSPANLMEACLSLFANLYEKDDLIDILLTYCSELDNAPQEELEPPPKKPKKKLPPNEPGEYA